MAPSFLSSVLGSSTSGAAAVVVGTDESVLEDWDGTLPSSFAGSAFCFGRPNPLPAAALVRAARLRWADSSHRSAAPPRLGALRTPRTTGRTGALRALVTPTITAVVIARKASERCGCVCGETRASPRGGALVAPSKNLAISRRSNLLRASCLQSARESGEVGAATHHGGECLG